MAVRSVSGPTRFTACVSRSRSSRSWRRTRSPSSAATTAFTSTCARAAAVAGWYSQASRFTPTRDEFVAAAARGTLIPVSRELLADGDTPVSAYAALGGSEHSFLLESVVGGATWAAYSFVGASPRAVV